MLLKSIGVIILIASSALFGFRLSFDYLERLKNLSQINKMLLFLKGEISYNNSGINEAIRKVSGQLNNVMGEYLKYTLKNFERGKISLKEAWNKGANEYLKPNSKLTEKDLEIVRELGECLGVTDRKTQINNIRKCMEVVDMTIHELNESRGEKCRLYRTLGVMSGVFLAIMLI